MSFRSVFIAVVIAFALILGAFLINRARPRVETEQPGGSFVRASGKCAECHARLQYSVVHEYEMSMHAQKGVNCLDCHQPAEGQEKKDHHGFVIARSQLTAGNCRELPRADLPGVSAQPPCRAVVGGGLWREGTDSGAGRVFRKRYQPGGTRRPPHPLCESEGASAMASGCEQCHSVGKPNADGTIGTCTACHTRHTSSVAIARLPTHLRPVSHGPRSFADRDLRRVEARRDVPRAGEAAQLERRPKTLTTRDMFVPTCATCHMSGINGQEVTHDPSERLSYYLANAISETRPNYAARAGQDEAGVRAVPHTPLIDRGVCARPSKWCRRPTRRSQAATDIVDGLRKDGVLTGPPFTQPIDFVYFDLWHYDGRTSKHGAFMGGADFVQWHGNYPMLRKTAELKAMADELRRGHAGKK